MCAELANRGVKDVLIACVDGLTGFPEAIAATWPQATVQTCTVHLIRNSIRFVSYGDRKTVAAMLRLIYTAATEDAAREALDDFAAGQLGRQYLTAVRVWQAAWDRFTPFLAFPPAVRKIIYTTDEIVKSRTTPGVLRFFRRSGTGCRRGCRCRWVPRLAVGHRAAAWP